MHSYLADIKYHTYYHLIDSIYFFIYSRSRYSLDPRPPSWLLLLVLRGTPRDCAACCANEDVEGSLPLETLALLFLLAYL